MDGEGRMKKKKKKWERMGREGEEKVEKENEGQEVTYPPRRSKPVYDDRTDILRLILPWAVYVPIPSP